MFHSTFYSQFNVENCTLLFPDTVNCLTFPVQPFELLLELVDEVADGGADGSQVEVSVDADRRPIGGLRRGRQRRQVLQEVGRAR